MEENNDTNFHDFALKTSPFKGRYDLYFCYLKAEKIAHALIRLIPPELRKGGDVSDALVRGSSYLPSSIARFAAGELEEVSVLVDLFELLSLTRLNLSYGLLNAANAGILTDEYEQMAQKISLGKNLSPFLSLQDLAVPPLLLPSEQRLSSGHTAAGSKSPELTKDIYRDKGHLKDVQHKGHSSRRSLILKIVNENKGISIKDIARMVPKCSMKTIQRELAALAKEGLIRKEGSRRWSLYLPLHA